MADPYVYKGTNVLKNKLNIKDFDELENIESLITKAKIIEPPEFEISLEGYRAIHRYIFEDLYGWSGEYRSVEMSKGNSPKLLFCGSNPNADQETLSFFFFLAAAIRLYSFFTLKNRYSHYIQHSRLDLSMTFISSPRATLKKSRQSSPSFSHDPGNRKTLSCDFLV